MAALHPLPANVSTQVKDTPIEQEQSFFALSHNEVVSSE